MVLPSRRFEFACQFLFRSGDGVLLVVKQFLDSQSHLDVTSSIRALTRAVLLRRQHREFGLPISQHVSLNAGEFANLSNLKKQLLGDLNGGLAHRVKANQERDAKTGPSF